MKKDLKVALVWSRWGPYHHARFQGLVAQHGAENCVGVSLVGKSSLYAWKSVDAHYDNFFILDPEGDENQINNRLVARQFFKLLKQQGVDVALLPSYWPLSSALLIFAARLAGVRCVMMNDSHAQTEKAQGWKKKIKRLLLRNFRSGLVAGAPQKEHFARLGMNLSKLFDGYDVVDNDYFARQAHVARQNRVHHEHELGLPARYILNLGRMVDKKNLPLLVRAYAQIAARPEMKEVALVLVGNGPEEAALRELALSLGLTARDLQSGAPPAPEDAGQTVFFAGFRQIEENPIFFALSEVFVLPSLLEEWGLVVNEAMACGVPVLVSRNVGSVPDLVRNGENGFQFDPQSADDLAQKMGELLDNADTRMAMGKASSRIIAEWGCDRFGKNAIAAARACFSD